MAISTLVKKILILAANPKDTSRLRLDEELREIDAGLRRAKHRGQFVLEQRWAVRSRDVQRAMLDVEPQIIHFSGHGIANDGLAFEDETGNVKLVESEALKGLFALFADQVNCVFLNACYSEVQAEAIAQHINYVVGMSQRIPDKAAIAFAIGFYDALGAGGSVEFAYKFGCNAMLLEGFPENQVPVLKKKSENPFEESAHVQQSNQIAYKLVLDIDIDNVDNEKKAAIIEVLKSISQDASLSIKKIEKGSLIIELEGSEEGFKIIQSLIKNGQITEILGLPIQSIQYKDEVTKPNFNDPIEVFFSYSERDEDWRIQLENHLAILKRQNIITAWYRHKIVGGTVWLEQVDKHLNTARLILLLISSDFMASDYCYSNDLTQAIKRHESRQARVIPILLRPVDWEGSPFCHLQPLPINRRPISGWADRDQAFLEIAQGIRAAVKELI